MTDETLVQIPVPEAPKPARKKSARRPKRPEYPGVLSRLERLEYDSLGAVVGIDDEITLMRVKIRRLLRREPNNTRLIADMVKIVAILVKLRYTMTDRKQDGLKEAVKSVLTELGGPLGVDPRAEFYRRTNK